MRFPAIFGGWRVEGYLCTGFWRVALVWPRFVRIWWRLGGWRRLRGPGAGLSGACSQAGAKDRTPGKLRARAGVGVRRVGGTPEGTPPGGMPPRRVRVGVRGQETGPRCGG